MTYQFQIGEDVKEYGEELTYGEIAAEYAKDYSDPIVLVKLDGRFRELMKKVEKGGVLEFVTMADAEGMRTYRRSILLLLYYCARKLAGSKKVDIRMLHELQEGYYFEITKECEVKDPEDFVLRLKETMLEAAAAELPIRKYNISTKKAREHFQENGMQDKNRLFHYRRVSHTNIYELDGYWDYFYGYMLDSTAKLTVFDLVPYGNGFMLLFPGMDNTGEVAAFTGSPKIHQTRMEAMRWAVSMGMPIIAGLNDMISNGKMQDMILVQEALMEKKISEIAENVKNGNNVKFVMIAGPSSSGKTTFANRLCVQLYAQGLRPHLISLDDFYRTRSEMVPDENGQLDFEALEALDVEEINRTLNRLLNKETVSLPTFNFKKGEKEYHGNYLKLEQNDVLVIEGIHGLNDALSKDIPTEQKYKVYISAMSQINIDENNSMSITDGRLLRRIIRDARTRGTNAAETISRWPSVRAGEEKHIFPLQENADIVFNSALIFELAIIKVYAEPLLYGIEEGSPEEKEARRLLKLLDYVLPYPADALNNNSILREFVGGSCFNV